MSISLSDIQQLLNDAIQPLREANENLNTEIQNIRAEFNPNTNSSAIERQVKAKVAQEETQNAINQIKERLTEQNVSFKDDEFNNPASSDNKKTMKISDLEEFDGTDVYSFELSVDAAMAQFASPVVAGIMARVLKGVAKTWFQNVDHQIWDGCLINADEFMKALKNEFAIDKGLAWQTARDRKWKVNEESVAIYYYDKLKLVGNSYGASMDASEKCFEVRDGLPDDFKVLIRTTLANRPTLESLRKELTTLETDYLTSRQKRNPTNKSLAPLIQTSSRPGALLPQLPPPGSNFPRMKQENMQGRWMSIRDLFDPRYIGSGPNPTNPNEIVWTYTVPDDTGQTLFLSRPCKQCGGQHFDFEPNHGKPVQSRMATGSSSSETVSDDGYSSHSSREDDTGAYGYTCEYLPANFAHQPSFSYGYPAVTYGYHAPPTAYGYPASPIYANHFPVSREHMRNETWDSNEFHRSSSFGDPIVIDDNDSYYTGASQRFVTNEESNSASALSKN